MAGMARFAQIAAELKIADPAEINALRERLSLLARQISSFIQERGVAPWFYHPHPTPHLLLP